MKKILFPFELDNPVYKEAYIFGIKFARKIHAELIVLNVFKVEVNDSISRHTYEDLKKGNWFKAYNEICKFNRYYLEQHVTPEQDLKVRFNYRFVNGILTDEVKEITRKESIDLLVLPLSDLKSFNRRQIKMIREGIEEGYGTSLLIVPYQCVYRPIKDIVFAIDYFLDGSRQHLDEILKIADAFDASIHFLHVAARNAPQKWEKTEVFRSVQKAIARDRRHVSVILPGRTVLDQVNAYVEKANADLLIAVRHKSYFLDTIFHDSVSDEISFKSKIPVMLIQATKLL